MAELVSKLICELRPVLIAGGELYTDGSSGDER